MTTGHVFIATSLDGHIARPDGDIGWLLERDREDEDHGYDDFIADIDGIIMGRNSYEKMLAYDDWPYTRPVIVASRSLSASDLPGELAGKVEIVGGTPRELMDAAARRGWKRAYVDGGRLVQSFLREGLIEDMVITQVPVLIGEGRPLFGPLERDISLDHVETRSFPSGLVQSRYVVRKG
ncbi:dihydrofolate reductase family protein [Oricola thermophila]|uniref:Dihydrofolate reductase n=1 Tax=Oricola thermophila TaxID=2742145 RepID=A0A6N1VD50_9HYPH|nr:dihydrofolate reductase family protein [Oricola thermophila]QKV18638.1 dihydrofolate reductase [Oricola thermophila]